MRDAAVIDGDFTDAQKSSEFFHAIRTEIEKACASGKLTCHHSPIPFLPHILPSEWAALPDAFKQVIEKLLFVNPPPIQDGPSIGTPEQMRDAVVFTNIQNYTPPPEITSPMLNRRSIRRALAAKTLVVRVYSFLIPVLIPAGLVAFLTAAVICALRRQLPLLLVLILAGWIEIALRLTLLAIITVSSFWSASNMYLSLAFPMSCLVSLFSFYLLRRLLMRPEGGRGPLPSAFRGVGETMRPVQASS
jgi:hypothetical protein